MTYTIDFFIGVIIAVVCPALLAYLLIWYIYCMVTSLQIYLNQRKQVHNEEVNASKRGGHQINGDGSFA